MANYPHTPVVSQIKLPSGNPYYIKDADARDAIDQLEQQIAGGVSFIIAWDGASTPVITNIPEGIEVIYEAMIYEGTLAPADATPGAFYLVKSSTSTSGTPKDVYDEYVVIKPSSTTTTWFWEKIGDTQIDLTDVVTGVELNKVTATTGTDTAIGTGATFTITQPTITLATDTTSGTGKVQVVTGGSNTVTNPTVTTSLSAETASATGRQQYVQSVSTTKLKATASGGGVAISDKDEVDALTSVLLNDQVDSGVSFVGAVSSSAATTTKLKATASGTAVGANGTASVIGASSTFTITQPTVKLAGVTTEGTNTAEYIESLSTGSAASSVSPTTSKLVTTSITGVSGSTSITPVESRSSQTTAKGSTTASTDNTKILANVSVANEILSIGAVTLDTQTTYSAGAPRAALAVPTAASATTVATGAATTSGTGASVVTNVTVGDTITVVTGGTTKYMSATASGANTAWNSKDTKTALTGVKVTTQPTVTLSTGTTGDIDIVQSAIGTVTPTNKKLGLDVTADQVIGTNVTFNVLPTDVTLSSGSTGDVTVATGGTTKYMAAASTATGTGATFTPTTTFVKATASGANTAWNNKDTVTAVTGIPSGTKVLTDGTTITVHKGQQ